MIEPFLSPADVARLLDIRDVDRVRRWMASGRIASVDLAEATAARRQWRTTPAAVEAFQRTGATSALPDPPPPRAPEHSKSPTADLPVNTSYRQWKQQRAAGMHR